MILALLLVSQFHHALVARKAASAPPSWSNTYSCKYAGTSTSDAGRTNFGQPAAWCNNLSSTAFSFSFWFKRNGDDGTLFAMADQSSNSHWRIDVSGTSLDNMYAGGQYIYTACGTTITNNTWYLVTMAFTGSGGVRVYVGNSSTSCIGAFSSVGSDLCTRDALINTLRSSTNSDIAFGQWGLHNIDELTIWNTELSGTDHVNLQSSGHASNPATHAKAANLIDYYRCGDDPDDSSSVLNDTVGSADGAHSGSAGVTYQAAVP